MKTGLIRTITNNTGGTIHGTYDGVAYSILRSASVDVPAEVATWMMEHHVGFSVDAEYYGLLPESHERVTLTNNTSDEVSGRFGDHDYLFEPSVPVPMTEEAANWFMRQHAYAGKLDRTIITPVVAVSSVQAIEAAVQAQVPTQDITLTVGANGSVEGNTDVSNSEGTYVIPIPSGSAQTFTMIPAGGYHVEDVVVDGVSLGTLTSYTFTNVLGAHTIAVTFAAD